MITNENKISRKELKIKNSTYDKRLVKNSKPNLTVKKSK